MWISVCRAVTAGRLLRTEWCARARVSQQVAYLASENMAEIKCKLPARYGAGEKSVWVEYIQLAADCKPAVNLGQGFPDYNAPPEHVTRTLAEVATGPDPLMNQYTRGYGHVRLVEALARLYSPLVKYKINPMNEVLVTAGAYEALYCAIMGHVDTGDEVIIMEPYFDCYEPMVRAAGGTPRFISLKPMSPRPGEQLTSDDWRLDEAELRAMFTPRTRMLILNTPHNPLGKVFTQQELELVAELCIKHNVICLSDEVYEWIVYKPKKHIRIASLPNMFERTITVGSAGKTFSVTGWKTGWAYGYAPLMANLYVVHQNCVYTHTTTIQESIARSLEYELDQYNDPKCYLFSLAEELLPKRDYMVCALKNAGFEPTVPDGGYFVIAGWNNLAKHLDLSEENDKYQDYRFTKHFAKKVGVLAIPPSAFYCDAHKVQGEPYARFCFIKKDENLILTNKLMQKWVATRDSSSDSPQ